jgi:hypothetical protein
VLDSYSLVLESSMYLAALPLSDQLLVFEDALQFFPFNNHLTRISMVFANHANWKDSQAFREILSEFFTYYVYKPDEQYMEAVLKEQFSEGSSRSASLVRYSKNDEQNVIGLNAFKIFQLTRMAEYCRDQGIRLVIVEVPTLNPSGIPVSKVRQLASEMHLPFHDFGEVFRGSYPEGHSLFREGAPNSHLNFNGSLLFSRFMAEMLAQELGLPYNSSASQKATRLVQTGLRIEDAVSADKTEINLILDPLHPDRALTYVWVVRDATGEILRKQSGAQNAFPIHIGYWGVENYQVEVKISSSDDPQEHLLLTIPLY